MRTAGSILVLSLAATCAAQQSKPIQIPTIPPSTRGTGSPPPVIPKSQPVRKAPEAARPSSRTPPARTGAQPPAAEKPTAPVQIRDPHDLGLAFPEMPPVATPAIQTATLSNGMKLFLLENHELPLIRGRVIIRTGNLFDPPDKPGVAELTGRVLRAGGTRSKTPSQLDEELENVAAGIESGISETSGHVAFECLAANVDTVLALLSEILREPEFRQDQIGAAKAKLAAEIARQNDDAPFVVLRELTERIYGRDTPYGLRRERSQIDRIERADLLAFHKRYFFPANLMVTVQGDFDAATLRVRIEQHFAGWTSTQPPVPAFPEVRPRPAPGIFLGRVDFPQTLLAIGHLGGRLDDRDSAAMEVMSDILGGSVTSRLTQRVRGQMGWALRVGAEWVTGFGHPGYLLVSAVAKPHASGQVIRAVLEEIDKMRTSEVSRMELERARDSAVNGYVFHFDHPEKALDRLVAYEYFGYPRDFAARHQKALAAVTAADVLRAAREHIRPQDLTIVFVGNPRDSVVPLEELRMKVEPFTVLPSPPKPSVTKPDEKSVARARELIVKTQRALGGVERLAAVRDYRHIAEMAIAQAANPRVKVVERFVSPLHYRQDLDLPAGRLSVYTDGKTGWMRDPQGRVGGIPGLFGRHIRGEAFRLLFNAALSDRNMERVISYAGDGLLQISDKQGNRLDLWVDEDSGLPRKQAYETVTLQGTLAFAEETFTEWREIQGLKVPWKSLLTINGRPYGEVALLECYINSGLKVEEIAQKP